MQIAYSTRSSAWYAADPSVIEALTEGRFKDLPNGRLEQLIADEFIVPRNENELATIFARNETDSSCNHSTDYMITIMPSNFCQLACGYCAQTVDNNPATKRRKNV